MRLKMHTQKLTLLMLVSLLALSSTPLSAQTQSYNPNQLDKIAQKLVAGEKCEQDKVLINQALMSCQADVLATQPSFFEKPSFIIGGFAFTFTIATIFGLTKCFGACK